MPADTDKPTLDNSDALYQYARQTVEQRVDKAREIDPDVSPGFASPREAVGALSVAKLALETGVLAGDGRAIANATLEIQAIVISLASGMSIKPAGPKIVVSDANPDDLKPIDINRNNGTGN